MISIQLDFKLVSEIVEGLSLTVGSTKMAAVYVTL
jgi:hypothetical protein